MSRVHRLIWSLLLVVQPAWAKKLPVPPIPPAHVARAKSVSVPSRNAHSLMKEASGPKIPVPPILSAAVAQSESAPVPDRDAHASMKQDATSRINLSVTDFRATTIDTSAGFVGGSRYRSAEDQRALQTPGLKLTVPFHLP
jgi:hypothetical protein